jgi:ATP-dependent DNA helicase PIF1
MELSKEQQLAFDKYVQGHNIFITGPGGAGKSALIRMINQDAYKKFKDIHITAMTGCASILLNCKAKTLHSWAGIGLGQGTIENYILRSTDKRRLHDPDETKFSFLNENLRIFIFIDKRDIR